MKILNYNRGFTLIELLIVILIIILINLIAMPSLINFQKEQSIKNTTENVISLLNKAQSNSSASLNSSNYGVHFESNYMIYFEGDTFINNDSNNERVDFEPGVIIPSTNGINLNGDGSDIIFPRLTGDVTGYGTIVLQLVGNSTYQKIITISKTGSIGSN